MALEPLGGSVAVVGTGIEVIDQAGAPAGRSREGGGKSCP